MVAVNRSPFYPWIAIALSLVVVAGFSRTYYLRFLSDLPPMTMLVHLHGLVFTAWLALFVAQTRLIAAHRVDLHMKLGVAGWCWPRSSLSWAFGPWWCWQAFPGCGPPASRIPSTRSSASPASACLPRSLRSA